MRMEDSANAKIKCTKLLIEADRKPDKMFWQHKTEETKRDWEHKLQIVKIYARILSQNKFQNLGKMYGNQDVSSRYP